MSLHAFGVITRPASCWSTSTNWLVTSHDYGLIIRELWTLWLMTRSVLEGNVATTIDAWQHVGGASVTILFSVRVTYVANGLIITAALRVAAYSSWNWLSLFSSVFTARYLRKRGLGGRDFVVTHALCDKMEEHTHVSLLLQIFLMPFPFNTDLMLYNAYEICYKNHTTLSTSY